MRLSRTLRRRLLEFLDRPGGRWLLGRIATGFARRVTGRDVSVFYDEVWIVRSGTRFQAESDRFRYYAADMQRWEKALSRSDTDARDYWFHAYRPQPGTTIVDVGAGVGTDIPAFSEAVGPGGKVLAIEAHPDTFLALRKTCQYNRLSNVICVQAAVMDRPGTVFIEDSTAHESNSVQSEAVKAAGGVQVPGSTLDALCAKHGIDRVDMLKMNIEGAERLAIRGMSEVIGKTRYAVIACHDFRSERGDSGSFSTRDEVVSYLREHGFEIRTRDDDPREFVRDHIHGLRPAS
jgi:FkbM family methyltransferase